MMINSILIIFLVQLFALLVSSIFVSFAVSQMALIAEISIYFYPFPVYASSIFSLDTCLKKNILINIISWTYFYYKTIILIFNIKNNIIIIDIIFLIS